MAFSESLSDSTFGIITIILEIILDTMSKIKNAQNKNNFFVVDMNVKSRCI